MTDTVDSWIEPENQDVSAEYWLTRRKADAADGYIHFTSDGRGGYTTEARVKYRWDPQQNAWITGSRTNWQGQVELETYCLHSRRGWRIEGPAAMKNSDITAPIEPDPLAIPIDGITVEFVTKVIDAMNWRRPVPDNTIWNCLRWAVELDRKHTVTLARIREIISDAHCMTDTTTNTLAPEVTHVP